MSFSRRVARPAYAAFLVAAASAISGCSLMLDFDDPIPSEDALVTDSMVDETSIDSALDSGTDTEMVDTADTSTVDADETSVDATETSVDADETSPDATETSVDAADTDVTDAADTSVDDAPDATDADDAADAAEADTAMCATPSDCPDPGTECATRTCTTGVCGLTFVDEGTAVTMQAAGDCKKVVCDGAGATRVDNDDTDLPNDSKQCTTDTCVSGVVTHTNVAAGTPCTEGSGTVCDGDVCVGCRVTADCMSPNVCNTTTKTCVAPLCTDGSKNGSETDIDCGGTCAGCALNKDCAVNGDCASTHCVGLKCVECVSTADCAGTTGGTCVSNVCTAVSCTDGAKNGSETDIDCGGSCTTKCLDTKLCSVGADCASGYCNGSGVCATPSCTDGAKNGGETDIDCGGSCTTKCLLTKDCAIAADCASNHCVGLKCVECESTADCSGSTGGTCVSNACTAISCTDGAKNGSETDIDCGGSCTTKCLDTKLCSIGADCASGYCNGSGVCATPSCTDGAKNGTETGVDCGGGCTATCAFGGGCSVGTDCTSGKCNGTTCVDCLVGTDCGSGICGSGGTCTPAACDDGVRNGSETDVDCGGLVCTSKCALTKACATGADCASTHCVGSVCVECESAADCASSTGGACVGNACAAPSCSDGITNGTETAADCGGSTCTKDCEVGQACATGNDCESGICVGSLCQAPSVLSTIPADGATDISTYTAIGVTFRGPMDGTTLTTQAAAGACTGNVQVSNDGFTTCIGLTGFALTSGNTVATWNVIAPLAVSTNYKIRVTTGAMDGSGNSLGAQYTSTTGFTTTTSTCDVVISQVYGGGGNTGATIKRDFFELHNRGIAPVNITGWSIQYGAAGATSSFPTTSAAGGLTVLSGTIQPGGYFLVGGAAGTGGTVDIVPDVDGAIAAGGSNGKIALVSNKTPLGAVCPSGGAVIDLVGYGTSTCSETAATGALAGATAARRKDACVDTNSNLADFEVVTANPRNASSAIEQCAGCTARNETDLASEADYCVLQFPTSDQTVGVGGTTSLIYGRIFESGVTNPAGAASNVVAQVGYGPSTVNPSTTSGWTWTDATFNVQVGNDDEYQSTITAPSTAGSYRYGYRFSVDSGATWTYCDPDGAGSNSGLSFSYTSLPLLTVTP